MNKIIWFKNNNTRTKNEKQIWQQNFIILTYANMNTKITWQGYDAKSCLKLMLNILKEMKGPTSIYFLLGT